MRQVVIDDGKYTSRTNMDNSASQAVGMKLWQRCKEFQEWGHIASGVSVGQPAPGSKWAKESVVAIAATMHKARNSMRPLRLLEKVNGRRALRRQTGKMAC
ncbi:hypothetical protein [Paraburkholderia nodosa]|uniref:hypothetical protein n=1 Tax=Paraburkholderia nodosa TaxID=392320 RepID=UPI00047F4B7F|nr:hypothetical protein [Paraburkholderia nodosa]